MHTSSACDPDPNSYFQCNQTKSNDCIIKYQQNNLRLQCNVYQYIQRYFKISCTNICMLTSGSGNRNNERIEDIILIRFQTLFLNQNFKLGLQPENTWICSGVSIYAFILHNFTRNSTNNLYYSRIPFLRNYLLITQFNVRRDIKDLQSFLENSTSYINLADTLRRYYTYIGASKPSGRKRILNEATMAFDSYLLRLPASFPLLSNGRHAPPGHAIVHVE